MKKKVSVIVPCYNVSAYIDKCMESLLNQSIGLRDVEIILVDDASKDDGATLQCLMQYENKFPDNIIVISLDENLRQGGARNVGIEYATGEYLLFCDADDYLSLCAMERLYNAAQMYHADVVEFVMKKIRDYTEIDEILFSGDKSYLLEMSDDRVKHAVLEISRDDFGLGCMNKFYRTDMIHENNIRFAEHYIYEEPSFTVPVRLYEKCHFYLDEVLYFYMQRPGSTMYAKDRSHYLDSVKVWNVLVGDLEKRGILEQYRTEIGKMYYDWAFLLNLHIVLEKGENVTLEMFNMIKGMVEERFPDIRSNPLFDSDAGRKEIAILDIDYTEKMQNQLREMLDRCLQTD